MELTAWVRSQLPPPPARILEIGCGDGQLARALADAGYEVLAIDPVAPPGEIFERTTIEELRDTGRFDAVVASRSLHHVDDLDVVLAKVARLAPLLVLNEFAWDRMDDRTADWYEAHRTRSENPPPPIEEWRRKHRELHGFAALRGALARHFDERRFSWVPYLNRYMHLPELESVEKRLIEAGELNALGFRFVGARK